MLEVRCVPKWRDALCPETGWRFGPSARSLCRIIELSFIQDGDEPILLWASRLRLESLQCWSCCRLFRQYRETAPRQYPLVYSLPQECLQVSEGWGRSVFKEDHVLMLWRSLQRRRVHAGAPSWQDAPSHFGMHQPALARL
jgi:hypothetical protein